MCGAELAAITSLANHDTIALCAEFRIKVLCRVKQTTLPIARWPGFQCSLRMICFEESLCVNVSMSVCVSSVECLLFIRSNRCANTLNRLFARSLMPQMRFQTCSESPHIICAAPAALFEHDDERKLQEIRFAVPHSTDCRQRKEQ